MFDRFFNATSKLRLPDSLACRLHLLLNFSELFLLLKDKKSSNDTLD